MWVGRGPVVHQLRRSVDKPVDKRVDERNIAPMS